MGIKFDLIYTATDGAKTVYRDCLLKGSAMVEITINKEKKERERDYLVKIPASNIDERLLLATLVVTKDNALGLVNQTADRENVRVYYGFAEGEKCFHVQKGKLFLLSKTLTSPDDKEFQEQDLNFSKVEFYYQGNRLCMVSIEIKEFILDEEKLLFNKMLDDYQIIERISGDPNSLYTVFKAEHKTLKGIELAIKRPSSYSISQGSRYEEVLKRMKKAMDFLSGHPYIPPVVQIVEKEIAKRREIAFVVMKYVRAVTLTEALKLKNIKARPFTMVEILDIAKKLSEVLVYLHQNGIAHRGVAPSNILINRDSNSFHLVGFGYSKLFWDLCDLSEEKNYHSIAPGSLRRRITSKTLDFMPPEFFNSPESFDARGDIYSFGAVFYKMLFTFGPYIFYILHDGKASAARFDVYQYYMNNRIPAPTVKKTIEYLEDALAKNRFPGKSNFLRQVLVCLRGMDKGLLHRAGDIIEKCLQINREQRYQSMEDLQHDLDMIIAQSGSQKIEHIAKKEVKQDEKGPQGMSVAYLQNHIKEEAKKKLRSEESEKIRKIKEQEAAIAELKGKNKNQAQEIKALQRAAEHQQEQIQGFQQELKQQIENMEQYSHTIENLEQKLAQKKQNQSSISKEHREVQALLQDNLQQIKDLRKTLIRQEQESYSLKKNMKNLEQQLAIFQCRKIFPGEQDVFEIKKAVDKIDFELDLGENPMLPGSNGVYYSLQRKAGKGGMGAVYKALRSDNSEPVAVKILSSPDVGYGLEFYLRFSLENYIILNLDHPCLMKGIDCVQHRYLIYSVAEFIEGKTILEMLEEKSHNPLDCKLAREIILQVARGLAYLDAREIVHRDIKPANIMVVENAQLGIDVKIVDFGIASHPDFKGRMTQSCYLMGTPDNMAPERLADDKWDIRSDIYSLGTVYYEMVTGRTPFGGDMEKIARGKYPEPRRFNPELSKEEQKIIDKMLHRRPRSRYQNAVEVIESLEEL